MGNLELRSRHSAVRNIVVIFALGGCYSSQEARQEPDVGTDAVTFDAPPDAVVPNLGLGSDCLLGGDENAFALMGRTRLTQGLDWRERRALGWWVDVASDVNGFTISTGELEWMLQFGAGRDGELVPGEYDVGRAGFDGPFLWIGGMGRSAIAVSGHFTVYEVRFVRAELTRFRAAFRFVDDTGEVTTGCIRYTVVGADL
jgi:hypothetical protein